MTKKPQKNIVKRLGIWAFVIAGILAIPLVTNAPWTGSDFIFAGTVLSLCTIAYEFLTRNMKTSSSKILVAAAILLFILMVIAWAATGPANETELIGR